MILIKIILTILAIMVFLGFVSIPFIDGINWEDSGIIGKFFTACFVILCISVIGLLLFTVGLLVYSVFTSIWQWKW